MIHCPGPSGSADGSEKLEDTWPHKWFSPVPVEGMAILVLLGGCEPELASQMSSPPQYASRESQMVPPHQTSDRAETGIPRVRFTEVTSTAGLHVENVSGSPEQDYILETMAAGAAFLDYDGDGYLDLFSVNGTRLQVPPAEAQNALYRNEPGRGQDEDRVFRRVEVDLGRDGWGMGCAVGDYDNDGTPDIYVTYWGPNQLWRNDGDGHFTAVGRAAGVDDTGWGSSAAFGDLDGDGLLDLYATNYIEFDLDNPPGGGEKCLYKGLEVFCGPLGEPAQADRLYRNSGGDRFADMSAVTGIDQRPYPGLGVALSDFDADGDLDIYVANDGEPNLLYRNDGDWQFVEVATLAGAAYSEAGKAQAGMGVHSGDYDNDGDLDLFATNFSDDVNTLYRNDSSNQSQPGLQFTDVTYAAGLGGLVQPYLGWGTGFFDCDNDGWLDLFVANGHLYPQLNQHPSGLRYAQRNLLYHNRQGRFIEVGKGAGPAWSSEKVSRAAALGDYDNDGDVDLFIANLNDLPSLLRNDGGNRHNWLGLQLVGTQSNRDAIGARVRVVAKDLEQLREVHRGYGFQAQHDHRLLFGLGDRQRVDRVEIDWPSGRRQVLVTPELRRYSIVREDSGVVLAFPPVPSPPAKEVAPEKPTAAPLLRIGSPNWRAEDYFHSGRALYEQGRYGEAQQALKEALQLAPDNLEAYLHLGMVLSSGMGRHREAADWLEFAAHRDSSRADIHYGLGQVYLSLNRPALAIEALERSVRLAPASWEFRNELGLAYTRASRLKSAAAAFQQASSRAPWAPAPHLHLAQVYRTLDKEEAAQRELQIFERLVPVQRQVDRHLRQLAIDPDEERLHTRLGMAYIVQNRLAEALVHLRQAIALDSLYGPAYYGLGTAFYRQQELERAIEAFERACRVQPEFAEAHNNLGRAYHQARRYTSAIAAYQKALALQPHLAAVYTNLGRTYTAQGRLEEAIEVYRQGLARDSIMVGTRDALARLYARQGRIEEAVREWEIVRRLAPDYPQVSENIRWARARIEPQY